MVRVSRSGFLQRRPGVGLAARYQVTEVHEFGADLARVRVVELAQDAQRRLPGVAGGLRVSGGVVGVTEVGE